MPIAAMPFDSLSTWLRWLEQCHPSEIDLGLSRIKQVAERLNLLVPFAKVVTVAGTNGKGSCVTATAALLRAAGYSVGVYTSPHLLHYNERIVIDGKPVDDEELCAAFTAIYSACQPASASDQATISLTYFEYGTLAALEIFRRHQVTAMVLEVGLGGRLDAVNIVDADVAVITSIAIDHQEWLGDNREQIGREKAGIMRSKRIAICADSHPPVSLINYAAEIGTDLQLIHRDFDYQVNSNCWSWWNKNSRFDNQSLPHLPLPSLAAALQVVSVLGIQLEAINAFSGLSQLRVPGRFQTMTWQGRTLILDVAHNPAATEYLATRLQSLGENGKQTYAIVAMMSDKDRHESLRNLVGSIDHWFLADLSEIPRAATTGQLRQNLNDLNLQDEFAGSVEECLATAVSRANAGDRIIIFGSFYTVAAGLQAVAD